MRPDRRQILLEIVEFAISGVLLVFVMLNPSFTILILFLVLQYAWEIVNTIGWYTWVKSTEPGKGAK